MTRARFVYVMRRSSYEHDWGKQYQRPTLRERFLAVLFRLIPPIGPLRALRFKMPTPEVEKVFMQSFDRAIGECRARLDDSQSGRLHLENVNYDLGKAAKPGEYKLQDRAYAYWLDKLAEKSFSTANPEMREALLTYYQDPGTAIGSEKRSADRKRSAAQALALKAAGPASAKAYGSN